MQVSKDITRSRNQGHQPVTHIADYDNSTGRALPIALMTAIATTLEVWGFGSSFSEPEVRATVGKFAENFGAPAELQDFLQSKITPFCLELCQAIERMSNSQALITMPAFLAAAIPERPHLGDYLLGTHEQAFTPISLADLRHFKREHGPAEYFIWIDESHGKKGVFVNNETIRLGHRLRAVLRYLVEFRGQCITHLQLFRNCRRKGDTKTRHWEDMAKTSRRWVEGLRKAGGGQLRSLIKTYEGGFAYEGPSTFCIIKPFAEQ